MEINDRVKVLREKLGLIQTAFGAKINMQGAAISRIEKGDRGVTDRVIADICRVYGVNERWLRHGEGEMFVRSEDAALTEFLAQHNITDELDRWIITEFAALDDDSRLAIRKYIRALANRVREEQGLEIPPDIEAARYPPNSEPALTLDEEPIDYDDEDEEDEPAFKRIRYKPVPIIGTVAAGLPMLAAEDFSDGVRVDEDDWEPGIVALRIQGDSMEPDYPDGSVILVRPTDSASAGDLVIAIRLRDDATNDSEATFKRLVRRNGHIVLRAINDDYEDQEWDSTSTRIYGIVLGGVED